MLCRVDRSGWYDINPRRQPREKNTGERAWIMQRRRRRGAEPAGAAPFWFHVEPRCIPQDNQCDY